MDLAPPGDPELRRYLSNLGNSLRARFQTARDAADLDAAIDAGRRVVDLKSGPPRTPETWPTLRLALIEPVRAGRRCRGPGRRDRRGAAGRGPDPAWQSWLAPKSVEPRRLTLLRRFEHGGDAADLDAAIDAGAAGAWS